MLNDTSQAIAVSRDDDLAILLQVGTNVALPVRKDALDRLLERLREWEFVRIDRSIAWIVLRRTLIGRV